MRFSTSDELVEVAKRQKMEEAEEEEKHRRCELLMQQAEARLQMKLEAAQEALRHRFDYLFEGDYEVAVNDELHGIKDIDNLTAYKRRKPDMAAVSSENAMLDATL